MVEQLKEAMRRIELTQSIAQNAIQDYRQTPKASKAHEYLRGKIHGLGEAAQTIQGMITDLELHNRVIREALDIEQSAAEGSKKQ